MLIITFVLSFVLARIVVCVLKLRKKRSVAYVVSSAVKRCEPANVMVVAGSGWLFFSFSFTIRGLSQIVLYIYLHSCRTNQIYMAFMVFAHSIIFR